MIPNYREAKKFDTWMRKLKNIHYSNHEKMMEAYERIEALKINNADYA